MLKYFSNLCECECECEAESKGPPDLSKSPNCCALHGGHECQWGGVVVELG